MGAWGYKNTECDALYDHLGLLLTDLVNKVASIFETNEVNHLWDEYGNGEIIGTIDIIITLCAHYETSPEMPLLQAQMWKTKCLEAFDYDMKARGSSNSKYATNRRPVIVATFDRFIELVRQYEED